MTHKYNDSGDADAQYTESKTLTIAKLVMTYPNSFVNVGDIVPVNMTIYPSNLSSAEVTLDLPSTQDPEQMIVSADPDLASPLGANFIWTTANTTANPDFYVQINHAQTHVITGTMKDSSTSETWTSAGCPFSPKVALDLLGDGTYIAKDEYALLMTSINPDVTNGTVSISCAQD